MICFNKSNKNQMMIGKINSHYKILEKLGEGRMDAFFHAESFRQPLSVFQTRS